MKNCVLPGAVSYEVGSLAVQAPPDDVEPPPRSLGTLRRPKRPQ